MLLEYVLVLTLTFEVVLGVCDVAHVDHDEPGPTSTRLTWTTAKDCDQASYEVTLTKISSLACDQFEEEEKETNYLITDYVKQVDETFHLIEGLKPYTEYEAKVIPQGEVDRGVKVRLTTPQSFPETRPGEANPVVYSQAITFYWNTTEDCRKLNGPKTGYRVELWGHDPWVLTPDRPILSKTLGKSNLYYVHQLLPFTRYLLKVFVLNGNGVWNRDLPLELVARTLPNVPLPPTNIKPIPYKTSVHLSWRPPYPPTGKVVMYQVRYGIPDPEDSNAYHKIVWKLNQNVSATSECVEGTRPNDNFTDPMCWLISGLEPNTTYVFELKTINEGVPTMSNWSHPLTIRTNPEPNKEPPTTTDATRTPRANSAVVAPKDESEEELSQVMKIIIILLTVVAVFVIIIAVLVYKIKVNKLKMQYEQQNAEQQSSGSGSVGHAFESSRLSMSSTYAPGMSTVTNMTNLTGQSRRTSNSSRPLPNWSTQMTEIQSRRLPEPPPLSPTASHQESLPKDLPEYTDAYCNVDVSDIFPPSKRGISEEDIDDIGGYLRPTFNVSSSDHPLSSTPVPKSVSSESISRIPIESYVSGPVRNFEGQKPVPQQRMQRTESHPLVSNSVDI